MDELKKLLGIDAGRQQLRMQAHHRGIGDTRLARSVRLTSLRSLSRTAAPTVLA